MDDKLRRMAEEVLEKAEKAYLPFEGLPDYLHDGTRSYVLASANAAPQLAKAWLEQRAEIERLDIELRNKITEHIEHHTRQDTELARLRSWAKTWKQSAKNNKEAYEVMKRAIEDGNIQCGKLHEANRLMREALEAMLYKVDYTCGSCALTDMISGVLDKRIIALAHAALASQKNSEGGRDG